MLRQTQPRRPRQNNLAPAQRGARRARAADESADDQDPRTRARADRLARLPRPLAVRGRAMILFPRAVRIYVATQPVSMRKSFDGLANEVRSGAGPRPAQRSRVRVPQSPQDDGQAAGVDARCVDLDVGRVGVDLFDEAEGPPLESLVHDHEAARVLGTEGPGGLRSCVATRVSSQYSSTVLLPTRASRRLSISRGHRR